MGLGHLCGGGGIRGETIEYGTEYGVTAGDLCVLAPPEELHTTETMGSDYSNPIRFKRSDGKYVYIYVSNSIYAAIENGTPLTLHTSSNSEKYTLYDGYLASTDLVHLFVYNTVNGSTANSGLRVLEIDISTDNITLKRVVYECLNSSASSNFVKPSYVGKTPVHNVGDNEYIFVCSHNMAYPIYDNGQTFNVGNAIICSNISAADSNNITGVLYEKHGILNFIPNILTGGFGFAFKYTYTLNANNVPELTVNQIAAADDCSKIQRDRYSNKSFLFAIDTNNYVLVNNSESGIYVNRYTLIQNTLTQIGASLSVQVLNRCIISGMFEGKVYIYSGGLSGSTSSGYAVRKSVIDVSNAPEVLSNDIIYVKDKAMWSGTVTDTRYVVEEKGFRLFAYLQYGNTTMYEANFKPLNTAESSPKALYAMGSIIANNYGKFRVQPEED